MITNASGTVTSAGAVLTVNVAPTITAQPLSVTAGVGAAAVFTVTTVGTPTLRYQWRKDGVDILNEILPRLVLGAVQPGDAGSYSVFVSNGAGSTNSLAATLTVVIPPRLTTQPVSRIVTIGDAVTFTSAATGAGGLRFQWLFNGTNIVGATNDTLTLTGLRIDQSGSYRVSVTDSQATSLSDEATLTVVPASSPVILTQPQAQTVSVGDSARLSVTVVGLAPLRYQWLREGTVIPNATNAAYTTPSLGASGGATYSVEVTNSLGLVRSAGALVRVVGVPEITAPLLSQTVSVGGTLTLTVAAAGSSLNYVWIFNGQFVTDATTATLVITNAQLTNAGSYTVVVGNAAGLAVTSEATVTVDPLPLITGRPVGRSILLGDPALFTVGLLGQPPFSYQWRRNTVDLPGETNSSLIMPAVGAASAGRYSVHVGNSYGTVDSDPATLSVTGPPLGVRVAGGQLSLSIPPAGAPFVLEYTDGFGPGHVWLPVTNPNIGPGGEVNIPINLPAGARLFRLRLP